MRMVKIQKSLVSRLGHADVGITLDIYSHSNQELQRTGTAEEARTFLEHCDQLRWKAAFTLALHTGLHRGEILALMELCRYAATDD